MAKQSPAQKATVERVMHEFKHGELKGSDDKRVKNPKQAVAIALSEAGSSNQVSPKTNKRNLARIKREEHAGTTGRARAETAGSDKTKAELYAEAKHGNVPNRSTMSKAELAKALHH